MDIAAWLRELGLERYEQAFQENEIDAEILPKLNADDLKDIGVAAVGHRRKLLEAIAALAEPASVARPEPSAPADGALRPRVTGAERRQLTVMFVDLVGSTELSARLDPEDMSTIIRAYQNTVAGEITRFEGHIAKYMGDGVLAYFGYPKAHEDEAERAVRTGLALTEAVGKLATPAGESLAARVGIATGLAVVGDLIGEGASQEQAVVGDTPNLAARLQALGEPGQVVIAEATGRLVGAAFELRNLGPQTLKGLAEPVAALAVTGERATQSRFEARIGPTLLPMVGRDQELALLLERWAQAKAGEGQGVLLVGEAGIGKSRIARALLDAVADELHTLIRYQCSPYHTDSALWPVIQQLIHAAGIAAGDPTDISLDKLERLIGQATHDIGAVAPLLASLLGVDGEARYGELDLTPQAQRARTLESLVEQLLGLAARQPVLVVLEDAHWIDPTTLELIEQSANRIAAARVLILLTSRPDQQPQLATHPHVTSLTLNRLGGAGVEAIVAWLGGENLPREVVDRIINRADGVPLFVEELTKTVLETGQTAIPASLYDLLMSRLDRFPEVKEVAQIAACIGREFSHGLLAAVSARPEAHVGAILDKLVRFELVFRRGSPPDSTYTFKHALIRDAAYGSLLKSRRREAHTCIVQALEARFVGTVAEPEVLAYHCGEAGLTRKAVDYRYRAGQQAIAQSAMVEAVVQLNHAIELLAELPDGPERRRQELDLQIALGSALISARGYAADQTGRTFARARTLCQEAGDGGRLMPILNGQILFHGQRGEPEAAHKIAGEMLELAEQHGDPALLIPAHRAISLTALHLGRFAATREHAKQVLALYDPAQHRALAAVYTFDQQTVALTYLASTLFVLGYPDQAQQRIHEAVRTAQGLSHPASLAQALLFSCILQGMSRNAAGLGESAEAMVGVAVEHGQPYYLGHGRFYRGLAWLELGRAEAGLVEIRDGEAAIRASGGATRGDLRIAEAYVAPAHRQLISSLLAEAVAFVGETLGTLWFEAERHRMDGERQLSSPEPDEEETEACFRRAIEVAREQEAKMWELRAATSLAGLWAKQGQRQNGHDLLAPVYDWFTEGFDTADLKDAKAVLDELR